MAISTDDVKLYLRAGGTTENALIASLTAAAQKYIQQQTGKTLVVVPPVAPATESTTAAIDQDELYVLAVKRVVARMYSHRGDNLPERSAKEDPTVQLLINQIATCGDYV